MYTYMLNDSFSLALMKTQSKNENTVTNLTECMNTTVQMHKMINLKEHGNIEIV